MNPQPPHSPPPLGAPADWLDQLLASEATNHADDYIGDEGFAARVMRTLPVPDALPAWRQPVVVSLWLIAAAFLAATLPGTAHEVAREAFMLFTARPFSLSTIALALAAIGVATWTGAAVALRGD
ncbi:MAG TPA: hypothetical protein VIF33_06205 [Casimicrobiaceae bacterium]|jgi:hypothetical protein